MQRIREIGSQFAQGLKHCSKHLWLKVCWTQHGRIAKITLNLRQPKRGQFNPIKERHGVIKSIHNGH